MKKMTSGELRSMWLNFFKSKGHAVIPSASVIPENDPTVLFTTAGMHPLVPVSAGREAPDGHAPDRRAEVHPHRRHRRGGRRSPPDLLRDAGQLVAGRLLQEGSDLLELGVPDQPGVAGPRPGQAWRSPCSRATRTAPRDEEAANYWTRAGREGGPHLLPAQGAQLVGPRRRRPAPAARTPRCSSSRIKPPCGPDCSPACSCGRYLEIWNDVFMQYNKQADGTFMPLAQKNVDTGMGLERTICVLNGAKTVYETDALRRHHRARSPSCPASSTATTRRPPRAFRIIADHMRTSTFIMGDDRGRDPLQRGSGLRPAPPDPPRRAPWHEAGHARGLHLRDRARSSSTSMSDVYPELEQQQRLRSGAAQARRRSASSAR